MHQMRCLYGNMMLNAVDADVRPDKSRISNEVKCYSRRSFAFKESSMLRNYYSDGRTDGERDGIGKTGRMNAVAWQDDDDDDVM